MVTTYRHYFSICCGQLQGLLYRAVLIKLSRWRLTLLEILVPALFFLVAMCLLYILKPKELQPADSRMMATTLPGFLWELDEFRNQLANKPNKNTLGIFPREFLFDRFKFGFAPRAYGQEFVKIFRYKEIFGGEDNIVYADNEADLIDLHAGENCPYGDTKDCISIGIFFLTDPIKSLRKSYKIIAAPLMVPDVATRQAFSDCYNFQDSHNLTEMQDMFTQSDKVMDKEAKDRFVKIMMTCNSLRYGTNAIPQLQILIDTTLIDTLKLQIKEVPPDLASTNLTVAQLQEQVTTIPYTTTFMSFNKTGHSSEMGSAQYFVVLCIVMSVAPYAHFLLTQVVAEKENNIKHGLMMMGMMESINCFSWMLIYTIEVILSASLIIGLAYVPKIGVFRKSNPAIFGITYILYGETVLIIAFTMSAFFSRAILAGVFGAITYAFFALMYLVVASIKVKSKTTRIMLSLISPCAEAQIFEISVELDRKCKHGFGFSSNETGCSWNNALENFGDSSYLDYLWVLIADIVIYSLICAYVHMAIQSDYEGVRKLIFFMLPSYWVRKRKTEEDILQLKNAPPLYVQPHRDIEDTPKVWRGSETISLVALRKEWRKGEIVAIENLTFDIYKHQITCLLGHNGAGKTTTINMMTGITAPTHGTVMIHNLDITYPEDAAEIRRMMGVCPQFDILYDNLTPRQHLMMVGLIKGFKRREVLVQAEKMLRELQIIDLADEEVGTMTNGDKRKLSVAIALFGDPKVVFLDEPSSGMDPHDRRQLWDVLQRYKKDRTILLTTHFMDEADILADRKAIIANGHLRCMGSSLFLKNRFGVGYHMSLQLQTLHKEVEIVRLVKRKMPKAELVRYQGRDMSFLLPMDDMHLFPSLFEALEEPSEERPGRTVAEAMGLKSYGIAMTTLEEVFLKLGEEAGHSSITDAENPVKKIIEDKPPSRRESLEIAREALEERAQNPTKFADAGTSLLDFDYMFTNVAAATPHVTIGQRFLRLLQLWFLLAVRNSFAVLFRVILPVVLLILGFVLLKFTNAKRDEPIDLANMYGNAKIWYVKSGCTSNVFPGPENGLVAKTWFKRDIEEVTYFPKHTNPFDLVIKCDTNFLYYLPSSAGDDKVPLTNYPYLQMVLSAVQSVQNTAENSDSGVTRFFNFPLKQWVIYTNDTLFHSIPYTINLMSNHYFKAAVLMWNLDHKLNQTDEKVPTSVPGIETKIETFQKQPIYTITFQLIWATVMIGFAFTFPAPSFAAEIVRDRQRKVSTLLRVNGIHFSLYWHTLLLAHMVQCVLLICLLPAVIAAFSVDTLNTKEAHIVTFFLTTTFCVQTILFCYAISFAFTRLETCINVMPTILMLVGFFPFMVPAILYLTEENEYGAIAHKILCIIDPLYIIFGGVFHVARTFLTQIQTGRSAVTVGTYLNWENDVSFCIFMNVFHSIVTYLLLRIADTRSAERPTMDAFCINSNVKPNMDNPFRTPGEDKDVQLMRNYVTKETYMNPEAHEPTPLLILNKVGRIFKETWIQKLTRSRRHKPIQIADGNIIKGTLAIQNVSLATFAGEIFGLLGPTGAGKTTTLRMICGDLPTNYGQILIDLQPAKSVDERRAVGYCPEHDALWDDITIREHLNFYAVINGMNKETKDYAINFLLDSLKIREHCNKKVKELSGGTKRKLSFSIATLGSTQVVLLDEPSVGMDPQSKRFLWRAISWAFQGQKGCLLTTQSMEEAEALCDRVAILVNGQLQCVGTTQHLISTYGKGYYMELKANKITEETASGAKQLEEFVHNEFPNAVLVQHIGTTFTYHLPQLQSLAKSFQSLEFAKNNLQVLDEYSLSQPSLEQVFLQFAERQGNLQAESIKLRRVSVKDSTQVVEPVKLALTRPSTAFDDSDSGHFNYGDDVARFLEKVGRAPKQQLSLLKVPRVSDRGPSIISPETPSRISSRTASAKPDKERELSPRDAGASSSAASKISGETSRHQLKSPMRLRSPVSSIKSGSLSTKKPETAKEPTETKLEPNEGQAESLNEPADRVAAASDDVNLFTASSNQENIKPINEEQQESEKEKTESEISRTSAEAESSRESEEAETSRKSAGRDVTTKDVSMSDLFDKVAEKISKNIYKGEPKASALSKASGNELKILACGVARSVSYADQQDSNFKKRQKNSDTSSVNISHQESSIDTKEPSKQPQQQQPTSDEIVPTPQQQEATSKEIERTHLQQEPRSDETGQMNQQQEPISEDREPTQPEKEPRSDTTSTPHQHEQTTDETEPTTPQLVRPKNKTKQSEDSEPDEMQANIMAIRKLTKPVEGGTEAVNSREETDSASAEAECSEPEQTYRSERPNLGTEAAILRQSSKLKDETRNSSPTDNAAITNVDNCATQAAHQELIWNPETAELVVVRPKSEGGEYGSQSKSGTESALSGYHGERRKRTDKTTGRKSNNDSISAFPTYRRHSAIATPLRDRPVSRGSSPSICVQSARNESRRKGANTLPKKSLSRQEQVDDEFFRPNSEGRVSKSKAFDEDTVSIRNRPDSKLRVPTSHSYREENEFSEDRSYSELDVSTQKSLHEETESALSRPYSEFSEYEEAYAARSSSAASSNPKSESRSSSQRSASVASSESDGLYGIPGRPESAANSTYSRHMASESRKTSRSDQGNDQDNRLAEEHTASSTTPETETGGRNSAASIYRIIFPPNSAPLNRGESGLIAERCDSENLQERSDSGLGRTSASADTSTECSSIHDRPRTAPSMSRYSSALPIISQRPRSAKGAVSPLILANFFPTEEAKCGTGEKPPPQPKSPSVYSTPSHTAISTARTAGAVSLRIADESERNTPSHIRF